MKEFHINMNILFSLRMFAPLACSERVGFLGQGDRSYEIPLPAQVKGKAIPVTGRGGP
jgi:hypothetical protein